MHEVAHAWSTIVAGLQSSIGLGFHLFFCLEWQWIRDGEACWFGKSLQIPIASLSDVSIDPVAAVGVLPKNRHHHTMSGRRKADFDCVSTRR